jgi:hypothetical protein
MSGIPLRRADIVSQFKVAEKKTMGRDSTE